jgi:hypothetical protein
MGDTTVLDYGLSIEIFNDLIHDLGSRMERSCKATMEATSIGVRDRATSSGKE